MATAVDKPDTGYAWVILTAATGLQLLISSSYASLGMLMVEYLEYFGQDEATTAWVGAIQLAASGMMGLPVGPLVQRYGYRRVSQAGTVLVVTGYLTSALAPSIYVLYVTHGFITGTGYACWIVSVSVAAQHFFDQRRGLALAVASSGLSVGVLIWPSFMRYTIAAYTFRGALVLLGAVNMHGLVLSALLRQPHFDEKTSDDPSNEVEMITLGVRTGRSGMGEEDAGDPDHLDSRVHIADPRYPDYKEKPLMEPHGTDIETGESEANKYRILGDEDEYLQVNGDYCKQRHIFVTEREDSVEEGGDLVCKKHRGAVDDGWEDVDLRAQQKYLPIYRPRLSIADKQDEVENQESDTNCESDINCHGPVSCISWVTDALDISLLTNPTFSLYVVSAALIHFGHMVPYSFIPLRVINSGNSKQSAALLVSVMGIGSGTGRLFFGWVGDLPCSDRKLMFAVANIVVGGISAASYVIHDYHNLVAYCMVFALVSACYSSVQATIMGDIIPIEKLSRAVGLFVFLVGLALMTSTSFAGYLIDISGDAALPFLVNGLVQSGGGGIALLAYWSSTKKQNGAVPTSENAPNETNVLEVDT